MSHYNFKIENVVSTTKFSEHFDLDYIVSRLKGAEYNKPKFPGLVYKTQSPRAVFLLFSSGKVVCTGCKSIEYAIISNERLHKKLTEIGLNVFKDYDVKIQNIVASAEISNSLNLDSIVLALGMENIEYEPEQFPGLVYRMKDPKIVLLLFGSGKLVITGGKSPKDCEKALNNIKESLSNLNLLL